MRGWFLSLLRETDRFGEARELLERAVHFSPDNAYSLNSLASHLMHPEVDARHWDVEVALRLAKTAADFTGEQDAEILDTLARALHLSGHHREAATMQLKAIDLMARDGVDEATIATYRKRRGDYLEALGQE